MSGRAVWAASNGSTAYAVSGYTFAAATAGGAHVGYEDYKALEEIVLHARQKPFYLPSMESEIPRTSTQEQAKLGGDSCKTLRTSSHCVRNMPRSKA